MFISPWPTFGSYKNPVAFRVEASPYFWWWYALTLNPDYMAVCASLGDVSVTSGAYGEEDRKSISRVYRDFGDVRYEGSRYIAFARWWTQKLDHGQTRGVFLFAEPPLEARVMTLQSREAFDQAIASDCVVVQLPRTVQRKYAERVLDRILKTELLGKKGRVESLPKNSQARYHLDRPLQAKALKKTFDLFDLDRHQITQGTRSTRAALAKRAKLAHRPRAHVDQTIDAKEVDRTMTIEVSRYLGNARKLIYLAALGRFDYLTRGTPCPPQHF
jgi:hypothetical protein